MNGVPYRDVFWLITLALVWGSSFAAIKVAVETMPPMTMVFRVADAGVVGDLKPGDKVRFRAEQVSGAYHVQRIEKAP